MNHTSHCPHKILPARSQLPSRKPVCEWCQKGDKSLDRKIIRYTCIGNQRGRNYLQSNDSGSTNQHTTCTSWGRKTFCWQSRLIRNVRRIVWFIRGCLLWVRSGWPNWHGKISTRWETSLRIDSCPTICHNRTWIVEGLICFSLFRSLIHSVTYQSLK